MNKDCNPPDKNSTLKTPAGNAEQTELRTLSETQLKEALEAHQKWIVSKGEEGEIADLSFTDLRGVALSHRVLSHINLQGSNLKGSDLSCSKLEEAHLEHTNLSCSNLKEATLMGATLKDADIQDADFLEMEFAGADMAGAKLSNDSRILQPLEAVAEISKNARKIFFCIAACMCLLLAYDCHYS